MTMPAFTPGAVVVVNDEGEYWEYDVFIALHPEALVVGYQGVAYEIVLDEVAMVFAVDYADIDFEDEIPARADEVFGEPLDDDEDDAPTGELIPPV